MAAGAMKLNGCSPGHITESAVPALIKSGDIKIEDVRDGMCELVLQPGHHVMCIHDSLAPYWAQRSKRVQHSVCHPCSADANAAHVETRPRYNAHGGLGPDRPIQPYDFVDGAKEPYYQGSLGQIILKCKYSKATGTYPHAFHVNWKSLVRDPDPAEPSTSGRKRLKKGSPPPEASRAAGEAAALAEIFAKRAAQAQKDKCA